MGAIWIACHGYGQLAAALARALEPIAHGTRVLVAPEGLSRFYLDEPLKRHGADSPVGASWMTREDREHEIADQVAYLDSLAATVRREVPSATQLVVLGFSQGVATVCRWLAHGGTRAHWLILWSGPLPRDLPMDRGAQLFGGARITLVAGDADRVVPPQSLERDLAALRGLGLDAELVRHAGGHTLHADTLRGLAADDQ